VNQKKQRIKENAEKKDPNESQKDRVEETEYDSNY